MDFPELKGLKGGDKQVWINKNLDFIAMLNEHIGFERTAEVLYMKSDTLVSALKRAGERHRPAVTKADRALLQLHNVDTRLNDAIRKIQFQAEALINTSNKLDQLQENLRRCFEIQAQINAFMSTLLASTGENNNSNFTECILPTDSLELEPLTDPRKQKQLDKQKDGPTSRLRRDRLSYFGGPRRDRLRGPAGVEVSTRHSRFRKHRRHRRRNV